MSDELITTDQSVFDGPQIVADLIRLLRLRTTPIGMKMFKTKAEMEAVTRIRRPKDIHTTDQIVGQASRNGWLIEEAGDGRLVSDAGLQISSITYPGLSSDEIFAAVAEFYRKFYFRPGKIVEQWGEMLRSPSEMKRRLREGVEFVRFLTARRDRA